MMSKRAMLMALALAGATAASPALAGPAQLGAARMQVARAMVSAWHTRNWRKVADLFAPTGSLHSMMSPPVQGRAAIYDRVAALGAGIQSITLDVEHMGVIDGRVYIERVDRFVYKGKSGAVPVVGVLIFDKTNAISEWREYYDRSQLLREMSAAEEHSAPKPGQGG